MHVPPAAIRFVEVSALLAATIAGIALLWIQVTIHLISSLTAYAKPW